MSNQYGPWATPINIGPNPQLSAFWKRRLTMLVPTSQTSPVLSRRNLVCLVVAGAMMIVLPTFRVGAAAAEDEKPATIRKENAPSSVQEKGPRSKEQMSSEQPAKRDQAKAKEKTSAEAQAAERRYEATVNAYETGDADIEAVYRWSCRWMQAERAEQRRRRNQVSSRSDADVLQQDRGA